MQHLRACHWRSRTKAHTHRITPFVFFLRYLSSGPPPLTFTKDICWSPSDPWHMLTAAEDNVVQMWRPSRTITDEMDVEQVELE